MICTKNSCACICVRMSLGERKILFVKVAFAAREGTFTNYL